MTEEKTISAIGKELKAASEDMLPSFIEAYGKDAREGVKKLVAQAEGRLRKLAAERERIRALKKYETDFGEASVSGKYENMVRIMSIHKSKGLEFPIVFLA